MSDNQAHAEILAHLRAAGEEAKAFREQHPDSPLCGVAYKLSALCGEIEARLAVLPPEPADAE